MSDKYVRAIKRAAVKKALTLWGYTAITFKGEYVTARTGEDWGSGRETTWHLEHLFRYAIGERGEAA